MIFTILSIGSLAVIYSLYLELTSISKLEDMARFKMDTMSTRGNSLYGSRPTTPHGTLGRQSGILKAGVSRQPSMGESLYSVGNIINHDQQLVYSTQPESVYGGGSVYSAGTSVYGTRIGHTESLYSSTPRDGPVTQFGGGAVHQHPENTYSTPSQQENVYASLQRNQEQIYATIIN